MASGEGGSRDGRFPVYDTGGEGTTSDLYVLPLVGDRRPIVVAAEPDFQQHGDISPDGRLITYWSNSGASQPGVASSAAFTLKPHHSLTKRWVDDQPFTQFPGVLNGGAACSIVEHAPHLRRGRKSVDGGRKRRDLVLVIS